MAARSDVIETPTNEELLKMTGDLGTQENDLETAEVVPVEVLINVTYARQVDGDDAITLSFSETSFGDRKLTPAQAYHLSLDLDTASRVANGLRQERGYAVS